MEYALEERIGNPDLFTGRKEELAYFLKWIDDFKKEKSQSTALPARRKMAKTALMERLFIEMSTILFSAKCFAAYMKKR